MSAETASKTQAQTAEDEVMKKLYVGNLSQSVTEKDLGELFGTAATPYLRSICSVELKVIEKREGVNDDKKLTNYGFVKVPERMVSEILKLNEVEFYSEILKIDHAKVNEARKGGNKGKGGFRGRRWKRNPTDKYALPKIPADEKFDIIDCGANLTSPKFYKFFDNVFNRAREAGVTKFVMTGLTLNGCKNAIAKSKTLVGSYAAVGIHPHHSAKEWNQAANDELVRMCKEEKTVVAIGECGLDYARNYSTKTEMKEAFEAQCKIAVEHGKTILVHERDAFDDVKEVLSKFTFKAPVVMYCMTGSVDQIKEYLKRGYYIGITGYICKEEHGKAIREAIQSKDLPLNKMMLHSDSPHMVPNMSDPDEVSKSLVGLCGEGANEPHTLHVVVKQIATLLSMTPKDVAEKLNQNAKTIYTF